MNAKEAAARNLLRDLMNGKESETARIMSPESALRVILESYGAAISKAERLSKDVAHLQAENAKLRATVEYLMRDLSYEVQYPEALFNIFL